MATIERRGDGQWRAKVRKRGHSAQSRTFTMRADAERWARETEVAIERGLFFDRSAAERTTVGELVERYQRDVLPTKRGHHFRSCLGAISKKFGHEAVARLNGAAVAGWRDDLAAAGLAASTVRKHLAVLSKLLDLGCKEWGVVIAANPVSSVSRPAERNSRQRRLIEDEEARLLAAVTPASPKIGLLVRLGLATGARLGELWALEWSDVDLQRRSVRVRGLSGEGSKNGECREVPLSTTAVAVINEMPRPIHGDRLFSVWGSTDAAHHMWQALLRRARRLYEAECRELGAKPDMRLTDLRFHDLRHETASRFADLLSVHELAKVMGWKSIQMAMRYYHPRASDLARKLG